MKNRTLFFAGPMIGLALAAIPLSGCSYWKAYKARTAYSQYQDALAAGDMARARLALLALVHSDEDVADYWLELGKLQIQLGDYRGAYDAFSHAHELDRTNVEVLAMLTQLALLSGETDLANEQARTLALVAPDHPAVTLARGYAALKAGELDKAEADANKLLATTPNEPFAKVLQSRTLVARGKTDEAISVLEAQHQVMPKDVGAIRTLVSLYRARSDWRNLARIQSDASKLDPRDTAISRSLVEALLRAGDIPAAAVRSQPLLSADVSPQIVEATLDLWARYAPQGVVIPDATRIANNLSGERRVAFANYLNRVGKPAFAAALLGSSKLPVTHENARWNAVLGQALALQGRSEDARRLFQQVLEREPDQVEALRGRSALEARLGLTKQAVIDAQRLVTLMPNSGEDRLLLAQAFLAAGNKREVRRTLWQAFQELPDDERVYAALRSILVTSGDLEGERRLADEYADRRSSTLTKDFI